MEKKQEVTVSVLCVTYNHKDFIAKALDGFLMQKTNFPYEIVVHDDVSTDGTREILLQYQEKYPEKIRLVLQEENQFSKGTRILPTFLFPEIRGKYAAVCDGDDEWTYEGKLQEQYDFMEAHPEVAMCMHNAKRRDFETGVESLEITELEEGYVEEQEVIIPLKGHVPTGSYFFRGEYVLDYPGFAYDAPVGDDPLRFHCLCEGKIYYMNKVWAIRNYMHKDSWNYSMKAAAYREVYIKKYLRYLYKFNQYSGGRFEETIRKQIYHLAKSLLEMRLPHAYTLKELQDSIEIANKDTEGYFEKELQDIHVLKVRGAQDYVEKVLKRFVEKCLSVDGKLYIYGAGIEAQKCAEMLDVNGISFDGFVVSEGHRKQEQYLGKKVYLLKEIDAEPSKIFFYLGLNIKNRIAIVTLLEEHGYLNYV